MKHEDHQDRLVDMLLAELIGGQMPPDVSERVLARARMTRPAAPPHPRITPLPVKPAKSGWFAVAAMVALLAIAGTLFQIKRISSERTPVLAGFSGIVTPSGGRIMNGGSLQVGPGSQAVLSYADGTVVEVGPDSVLHIPERKFWDRSKGLELKSGTINARVSPQPKGSPMTLGSFRAQALVVGTELKFHVDSERTLLEVATGAVRFFPRSGGRELLVDSGHFAESGTGGLRRGDMATPGIRAFTLMNAETDQPMRTQPLADGEVVSLASLPCSAINIRADYDGPHPARVNLSVTRADGGPTLLPSHASKPHTQPPFFVAGDHWADGRPQDCAAWTPRPGVYRLSAEAVYQIKGVERAGPPLTITVRFTR
jgi:hypothetical protein